MWKWLKCILKGGHTWYVPNKTRKGFNSIGIYEASLMRHFCKKCGVGEDNESY